MSRKVHLPAVSSITFLNLSKFTEKWKLQTKFPLKKPSLEGCINWRKFYSRFFPKTKMATLLGNSHVRVFLLRCVSTYLAFVDGVGPIADHLHTIFQFENCGLGMMPMIPFKKDV